MGDRRRVCIGPRPGRPLPQRRYRCVRCARPPAGEMRAPWFCPHPGGTPDGCDTGAQAVPWPRCSGRRQPGGGLPPITANPLPRNPGGARGLSVPISMRSRMPSGAGGPLTGDFGMQTPCARPCGAASDPGDEDGMGAARCPARWPLTCHQRAGRGSARCLGIATLWCGAGQQRAPPAWCRKSADRADALCRGQLPSGSPIGSQSSPGSKLAMALPISMVSSPRSASWRMPFSATMKLMIPVSP